MEGGTCQVVRDLSLQKYSCVSTFLVFSGVKQRASSIVCKTCLGSYRDTIDIVVFYYIGFSEKYMTELVVVAGYCMKWAFYRMWWCPCAVQCFKDDLPLNKFWFLVQNLKEAIKIIIIENISKEEVLEQHSDIGAERASILYSCVDAHKLHLQNVVVQESIADKNYLKDFDWTTKVCVSSDKVLDLNEVLLTLDLHTATASTITKELTLEQVDQLLEVLKSADEKLLQISKT
ncbi:COMM domain-containing protein 8-like [Oratosquilla oratoria]|uniref:COMM domain-containing protein 8-like n=1 Tax=Oratosquilla oratoria TaxID=337810 RepID=UPI003F766F39